MSYNIWVDNENKGQVGSNSGLYTALRWLEKHGGQYSKELGATGLCENAYGLSQEIKAIIKDAPYDVAEVLKIIASFDGKHSQIGISQ
jgi:hypothetical protein